MTILTIEVLKKIIEHIPDGYTVEYNTETTTTPIDDQITIDVSGQRVIFK